MINVIMLHDIREKKSDFFFNRYSLPYFLFPEQFDNILKNINSSKGNIIDPKDFISVDFRNLNNSYVLTFDDGLKDHFYAAEKLHKLNIKAFFFVPVNPIKNKEVMSVHKIQFILSEVDHDVLIQEIRKNYSDHHNLDANSLNEFFESKWKNNIWSKEMIFITRTLREASTPQWRMSVVNHLFSKYITSIEADFCNDFYLSEANVKDILDMGHHIGGHGYYSTDLSYEDKKGIKTEIQKSKHFLSDINSSPFIFSYPNGSYNDSIIEVLKKNEFSMAFTTKQKHFTEFEKVFSIPRIDPSKTDLIL